jgi:hypothetical protein
MSSLLAQPYPALTASSCADYGMVAVSSAFGYNIRGGRERVCHGEPLGTPEGVSLDRSLFALLRPDLHNFNTRLTVLLPEPIDGSLALIVFRPIPIGCESVPPTPIQQESNAVCELEKPAIV